VQKTFGYLLILVLFVSGVSLSLDFLWPGKLDQWFGFTSTDSLLNDSSTRKNVTGLVRKEFLTTPVNMQVFHLLEPLLPEARLLAIERIGDSFWFSSDNGLMEYDVGTQQWFLRDKETGLPGDTAYDIAQNQGRLFLKIYDWNDEGKHRSLRNGRTYWLSESDDAYDPTEQSIEEIKAGGHFTTENSDLLHNSVHAALHYQGYLWLTSLGTHDRKSNAFKGGGVSMLDPQSHQGRTFTEQDGLAHSYSYAISASDDGQVWVTHFDEERGLSVFDTRSGYLSQLLKSANGIELGGVEIAVVGQYLIIGQQGALVVYDRQSQLAFSLKESDGLPGYIVTGISVDDEAVWVSAYGYAPAGQGSDRGGVLRIPLDQLSRLFDSLH